MKLLPRQALGKPGLMVFPSDNWGTGLIHSDDEYRRIIGASADVVTPLTPLD